MSRACTPSKRKVQISFDFAALALLQPWQSVRDVFFGQPDITHHLSGHLNVDVRNGGTGFTGLGGAAFPVLGGAAFPGLGGAAFPGLGGAGLNGGGLFNPMGALNFDQLSSIIRSLPADMTMSPYQLQSMMEDPSFRSLLNEEFRKAGLGGPKSQDESSSDFDPGELDVKDAEQYMHGPGFEDKNAVLKANYEAEYKALDARLKAEKAAFIEAVKKQSQDMVINQLKRVRDKEHENAQLNRDLQSRKVDIPAAEASYKKRLVGEFVKKHQHASILEKPQGTGMLEVDVFTGSLIRLSNYHL